MKKLTTLVLFVTLLFPVSYAQEWLQNLSEGKSGPDLTLADYDRAFNDYWEPYQVVNGYYFDSDGDKQKAPGWKQYQRWKYFMEYRVDTDGKFPVKTAFEVYQDYMSQKSQPEAEPNGNWTSLGPDNSESGYAGIGRLNCISFHPSDNNTYWVGAPAGGLWVTHDNGNSWQCLTDNNPLMGISDIVIPSDFATSNTIYIATGDRDAFDNTSIGVLKSNNAGSTWTQTDLEFLISDYELVTRLLLDPNDDNTILAATTNGVSKTIDGGVNWSTWLTTLSFIDMEYKPGDFNTLYGSTKQGDIYKSSDGGANWTLVLNSAGYRTELAVTPVNSSYVYAINCNSSRALYGIYISTNSGSSFSQVFDGTIPGNNMLGYYTNGSDTRGQGSYDLSIAVSQSNAQRVVIGGINTWGSTNGGSSWSALNCWTSHPVYNTVGAPEVHADKHMLRYRSNGDLFECNDGGIYISTDDGSSFIDKTDGIVISQIYKIGVARTKEDDIINGLQDNGSKLLSGGTWTDVYGGDGMECLIDYTDFNIQYASLYFGSFYRTRNHWGTRTSITPSDAGGGAWVTPLIIDPFDHNTLYAGYADVWKSTNQGDSWTKISTMDAAYLLRSLAIASSDNNVLYTADYYTLWKTTNGGSIWSNISSGLPSNIPISSIAVKDDNPDLLWVTFGGYNSHGVYQSSDGGGTWTNISNGLPELPFYSVVQDKQVTGEVQLYAGSELGVYFKRGTNDWVPFNGGLPLVTTRELEIYYDDDPEQSKIRLATYGRGLWESNMANTSGNTVTDYDGNVYNTVQIGDQWWMQENLQTIHYNDGEAIIHGADDATWSIPDNPMYCWYLNNESNARAYYGALYNGYAVQSDKLCPSGWHVPTDDEWKAMEMHLGMSQEEADASGMRGTDEGGNLKGIRTYPDPSPRWNSPNVGATNESGFTGYPGGYRVGSGIFYSGITGYGEGLWWSSTEFPDLDALWNRILGHEHSQIRRGGHSKTSGLYVRCVNDIETPCTDFSLTFNVGWNWFSINVLQDDMTLGNLFTCTIDGDYIKDQVSSATYYDGYGWFGSLTEIDPKKTYKIKVTDTCGINFCGAPVDVLTTSIDLPSGWSWIGYLPQVTVPTAEALVSLTLEEGDYIKDMTSSATYYAGYGWFGSLETLYPTHGYMMKKLSADVLIYPEGPAEPSAYKAMPLQSNKDANTSLDPNQFEFSGTVTAKVYMEGSLAGHENDMILGYVNDQLRGVAQARFFDPAEAYTFPMMVYSNLAKGETISFRYYNAARNKYYTCNESLVFTEDMVVANAFESFELHVNSTLIVDEQTGLNGLSLNVYPNPFNDKLHIEYSIAERSRVKIEVNDMMGKVVEILEEQILNPGSYSEEWNAERYPETTYILRLTTDKSSLWKRIVLIR